VKKKKPLKGKRLTNKLDRTIREIFKIKYKNPVCFVCGKNKDWFHPKNNPRGCQVGHFISRTFFAIRWDLTNLFPQCAPCNYRHEHNFVPFTLALIRKRGLKEVKRLNGLVQKSKGTNFTDKQKKVILEKLKKKFSI